jgi:hypothetical protein
MLNVTHNSRPRYSNAVIGIPVVKNLCDIMQGVLGPLWKNWWEHATPVIILVLFGGRQ